MEDKYRGNDVEGNEYSVKMKELRSEINTRSEGIQDKMKAEIDQIYSKAESYVSDNSDKLGSYETNLLNSKKSLFVSYVKIQKLKLDESSYKKLNKEHLADTIAEKIKAELDNYQKKIQKTKKIEYDYKNREKDISVDIKQKAPVDDTPTITIEYGKELKTKIDISKKEINAIKDSYKDENGKFVKDDISANDKERLKILLKDKNKNEYIYLRNIPERKRTPREQKKYSMLLLKFRQ